MKDSYMICRNFPMDSGSIPGQRLAKSSQVELGDFTPILSMKHTRRQSNMAISNPKYTLHVCVWRMVCV